MNPIYLMIGKVIGHIEENNGNKYLIFDSSDENKEVLKNTKNFGMRLKIKLRTQMMLSGIPMGANMEKILQKLKLTLMMICH